MVARPGVVRFAADQTDIGHQPFRQMLAQECFNAPGFGRDHEQLFLRGNVVGHLQVAGFHLAQHGCPVGVGVRPREHHAALRIPLGRPHVGGLFDAGRLEFLTGNGACGFGDGG